MVVTDENKNVIIAVNRHYRMGQRKSVPQPPPPRQPPPQLPPPGQSVSDKLVNHMNTNILHLVTTEIIYFYLLKIWCS